MKILLCHNFYREFGGEDAIVTTLKRNLESGGFDVIFYTRDNKETLNYNLGQKLLLFLNTFFSPKTYRDIKKIVRKSQPDVAHVHNVFPLISPSIYFALKKMNIPIVQTAHNFRFLCPNGLFYSKGEVCERCKNGNYLNAIIRKCYRNSYVLSLLYAATIWLHRMLGTFTKKIDKVICLSDFSASKLAGTLFPSEKLTVIPNFLSTSFVSGCKPERYAVYMGRLSEEKGVFALIKAFEGIEGFNLKVIGDGALSEQLKQYVRNKGIKNIEFLGFIEGEKRFEILKKAMFCIFPSECYENFPMAVLECFGHKVPVIASDIGALKKLIENGKNGLLFDTGNVSDLRDKIRYFANNPGKRTKCAEYARCCAETKYGADANYEKLKNIYKEVIKTADGTNKRLEQQAPQM